MRDLDPVLAVETVFPVLDLMGGLMGDESRDAKGDALVEVAVDGGPESCAADLAGSVSALRRDEVDDSRVRVGCEDWALLAGWRAPGPPVAMFVDLSMAAGSMGVVVETAVEPLADPHATSV